MTFYGSYNGGFRRGWVTNPYVSGIPAQFTAGDSVIWTDTVFADASGGTGDSTTYSLQYVFASLMIAPITVASVAQGSGWQTTISKTVSATFVAGDYSWEAQASSSSNRFTIANGRVTVKPDFATVGAGYDGRTKAQIALDQARAAFANFSATGGRVRSYTIGHRSMTFDDLAQIQTQVTYWEIQVESEKNAANPRRRFIRNRFDRIR
jgi:hypothetical protein